MPLPTSCAVEIDSQRGIYKVDDQIWDVGRNYKLVQIIGSGVYGIVCKGLIKATMQTVAVKRMDDVLSHHELAKRVLREVCIMRRLSHNNILSLVDIFIGVSKQSNKKVGTDVYIVTEYADKDLKPENVLLFSPVIAKICDFNLSRSVEEGSEAMLDQNRAAQRRQNPRSRRRYTSLVVTRNYRAPEVIMSHGDYTSAIDIWSLGCIFWELLSVTSRQGKASNYPTDCLFHPKLEEYDTPKDNEYFLKDGDKYRFQLLNEIFNVIGTPCWKDIESIPSHKWRKYLKSLPGKVGKLNETLGNIDKEALDLLSRMLCFDPTRRCTAKEALNHQYFKNMSTIEMVRANLSTKLAKEISLHKIEHPALALRKLEDVIKKHNDGTHGQDIKKISLLLENEVKEQHKTTLVPRNIYGGRIKTQVGLIPKVKRIKN
ncbi:mitogen-activated protein kinase 3 isoform X2 [Cryptomeria japonica]|uniref:mitogen-activated protein kinase 3 isoform X2 n=1 Tax=Cryptomeria japonica TaxID=3369 RepID=UPI0027DA9A8C|nr:mitogen-activated protein kinase 3 isoform X2 [Cryptomeria japonica]